MPTKSVLVLQAVTTLSFCEMTRAHGFRADGTQDCFLKQDPTLEGFGFTSWSGERFLAVERALVHTRATRTKDPRAPRDSNATVDDQASHGAPQSAVNAQSCAHFAKAGAAG